MSSKASQTSALGAQNQNANSSTKRHLRAPLPRLNHQSPYLYRSACTREPRISQAFPFSHEPNVYNLISLAP